MNVGNKLWRCRQTYINEEGNNDKNNNQSSSTISLICGSSIKLGVVVAQSYNDSNPYLRRFDCLAEPDSLKSFGGRVSVNLSYS